MQDRPWCSSKCVCHPGTVHQVMPQKRRDLTSPPRVRGAAAQAADRRAALSQQLRGIRSPSPWRKRVATGARLELEGYMLTREEAMANGSPAGADWIAAEKATNGAAPIETGARARRSSSVRPPPHSHCRQRLQRSPPPTALAHRSSCHHPRHSRPPQSSPPTTALATDHGPRHRPSPPPLIAGASSRGPQGRSREGVCTFMTASVRW